MKIVKLQQDLLNKLVRDKDPSRRICIVPQEDPDYVVVTDTYSCFWIPAKDFRLRIDGKTSDTLLKPFLEMFKDCTVAQPTRELRTIEGNKVVSFKNADGRKVWINRKYLEYFFRQDTTYWAKDAKSPLFVTEGEDMNLVAFIMPVRVLEGDAVG